MGIRGVIRENCGLCGSGRPRALMRLSPLTRHWLCADPVACCARFLSGRVLAAGQ